MGENRPGVETRLAKVRVAHSNVRPRLVAAESTALTGSKALHAKEREKRTGNDLVLFVDIDGGSTDAIVLVTRSRWRERLGTSPGPGKMVGVFLDTQSGEVAPLVVKETQGREAGGTLLRRSAGESSLNLSLTFSDARLPEVDDTVIPFLCRRRQTLPPQSAVTCSECPKRALPGRDWEENGLPAVTPMGETFAHGDLFIDFDKYIVITAGRKVEFPHMTTKLLFFLVRHPGRVYTRQELLRHVWGNVYVSPRNVDVHVNRIRKAIEKDRTRPVYIVSVLGVGYKFDDGGL